MHVLNKVQEVSQWRKQTVDCKTQTIGFVPTMGCLHEGHMTLVRRSCAENDFTVVSVFVNPSQFAPNEDLDRYPRTLAADRALLEEAGVDVLFAPSPAEMYPRGIPLEVEAQRGPFVSVLGVSEMLEGRTRPRFFRGVATVVAKLVNIVAPDRAYFGQKDIQQCIVVDTMFRELFMSVQMIMLPIERDANGLALSSRNKYMCAETIALASNIYRGLRAAATVLQDAPSDVLREAVIAAANTVWEPLINSGDFRVDYLSVADRTTLAELGPTISREQDVVLSCAIYVTDRAKPDTVVRLLDNILVPPRT
ncbi:AFR282Wp [Eremothecium gossypii ATCC 10895]|uniref:Pantoate--beta-alanine ligase n=1 Tax=Eremothecium gossypii (strain ATCC 10895 / CBS 109.51 / FGSC 9923 / NRRL Y-1056) TaxID=284811 RepID=Q753N0_EREGS|nr:AFR282Wp [Eremothecium gossypii ATCC 10895]AAS53653.2 AFR282Wp [Eremothecium gossypii ATCC 10895]AEY97966.1 FAFR282Wp [Eremothecium gossypii FDAG1]